MFMEGIMLNILQKCIEYDKKVRGTDVLRHMRKMHEIGKRLGYLNADNKLIRIRLQKKNNHLNIYFYIN